ncbi:hypothetical protein VH570_19495 [Sphingobium sp. HT1-2]|uniref:hypothetical protein n=1 Tax=Sphingobium sp. HT1-2 TaxID=3111640 RepID=UPI003C0694D9
MRELNEEYVLKIRRGLLQAICEASVPEVDTTPAGEPKTLYIGTAEACEALTMVLSEFLDGVPGLSSPTEVRKMTDDVARKLRANIGTIRRVRRETGGEPLPTVVINAH